MNKSLVKLMAGFRRFHQKYFSDRHSGNSLYQRLATGQTPKTLLIGCSDSRVDPAILTGAAPGDLFVVRNVANLVPPCEPSAVGFHGTSSALEFAVGALKVENVIVLGHRQCGGIRALMQTKDHSKSFIGNWMDIASAAKEKVLKENPRADEEKLIRLAEMEAIKVSIKNLHTFSFVQEAIEKRNMKIIGVYFDLEQGVLWQLDETSQKFSQVKV